MTRQERRHNMKENLKTLCRNAVSNNSMKKATKGMSLNERVAAIKNYSRKVEP
jgi:hypothetical protein